LAEAPPTLGIPHSRVAIYLLFAAELSFFASIVGAYVVLAFSGAKTLPFTARPESKALRLLGVCLALHVVLGAVAQLRNKGHESLRLFWKLTVLLVMCTLVVASLVAYSSSAIL
jgi:heme/copper-type cytochrome/quinol oxidase subunit 3